jgi:hypothetical protein
MRKPPPVDEFNAAARKKPHRSVRREPTRNERQFFEVPPDMPHTSAAGGSLLPNEPVAARR